MLRILMLNQLIIAMVIMVTMTTNSSMATPGRLLDYEGDDDTIGQLLLRIIDDVRDDLEDDLKDEREDRILRESELERDLEAERRARVGMERDLEAERRERTELEASVNHLSSALSSKLFIPNINIIVEF